MTPINEEFSIHYLENTLSQVGFFFVAKKSNQILIEKYFYCLPFFFMNERYQNILYKIITHYKISNYYDKKEHMKFLCYKIYSDFCNKLNKKSKSFDEFYNNFKYKCYSKQYEYKQIKRKHIHTFIFLLVVFFILIIYYFFINKTRQDNTLYDNIFPN